MLIITPKSLELYFLSPSVAGGVHVFGLASVRLKAVCAECFEFVTTAISLEPDLTVRSLSCFHQHYSESAREKQAHRDTSLKFRHKDGLADRSHAACCAGRSGAIGLVPQRARKAWLSSPYRAATCGTPKYPGHCLPEADRALGYAIQPRWGCERR